MMLRMFDLPPIVDPAGGAFGYWSEDADGSPVFVYTMDQTRDPRAEYRTSLGPSRDHWHQVGTGDFVSTVHNGGYTQIYDWSRGGKLINRWDPEHGHFAGGFLLVEINGEAFSTLWEGLPEGATQERRWGCNYAERVTHYKGVEIREKIAPEEGAGLSLTWSAINHTDTYIVLCVIAPWWLNLHYITPEPLMTYGTRKWIDRRRKRHGDRLEVSIERHHLDLTDTIQGDVLEVDLCDVNANPYQNAPDRAKIDRLHFEYHLTSFNQVDTRLFALRASEVRLDPKNQLPVWIDENGKILHAIQETTHAESDCWRWHLGKFDGASNIVVASARDADLAPGAQVGGCAWLGPPHSDERKQARPFGWTGKRLDHITLRTPGHAPLAREIQWHSAYLRGAATFSDYHGTYFVDQGSAYSYLQGLSGAPRDFALFVLPMIYLDPGLAKCMLRHLLVSQHFESGKLPYCTVGHGVQRGYGLHSFSSDLDLFLLWAVAEYLGATRDLLFLEEEFPYYPRDKEVFAPILHHLQAAFRHLKDRVGLGPHGMLRCGSGDWNDVLLGFSKLPPLTLWRGESALNAGLAALALPRLADALAEAAPDFAAELRAFGAQQADALRSMWTGRWAARGYLGYGGKKLGEDRLFLDAQAFGVLAGVWDDAQRTALFGAIDEFCVRPQGVGALALWPPMKGLMLVAGSDTNGGTWAAIDGLIAWAWAQHDPTRAWDFYQSTTLAARAEKYPDVWYGAWSGPDSFNAHYHPRPGETFCHNFTPMTDFPIMNMNRHAGPLLDAVKFAGIEPRGGAIEIRPRVPGETFEFRSALISLWGSPTELRCEYVPVATGKFHFRVALPSGLVDQAVVCMSGERVVPSTLDGDGLLTFTLVGRAGMQNVDWCIVAA